MRVATVVLASLASVTCAQELGSINLPRTDGLEDGTATNDQNYGSCENAAWPPTDIGNEIEPTQPDEELQAALKEVDPARIEAIIEKLVSFGTRHTLSDQTSTTRGIGAARNWIESEFRKYAEASNGQMTVEVSGYLQPIGNRIPFPVRIDNVIATLKGSEDPSRVYVISGHHDSRVTDVNDYTSDSPGANDDASGVAVSMELARIMATRRPKATIQFGSVAGEEQGLYGAANWAQRLRNASVNVEAMITNDIIGSSRGDPGLEDPYTIRLFCQGPPLTESDAQRASRLSIGGENDSPARQLGRYVAAVGANAFTGMSVAIVYRLDRFLRGGDHSAFLQQGYPGIRFTEPNENFAHQHQDIRVENGTQFGDLPEFVDYEFVSRVAKVNLATLWNLSNAPGKPRNVTVVTSTLGNDSEFRWVASNATDVEGYEVVWRATTAPLWTHAVSVGKVDRVTVPLSKDNVIFGIRAVGTNGFKSPAVYPGPNAFPA